MSRNLNDLSPEMRPLVVEFLARLTEERIPVVIVTTRRTPTEQAEKVRQGVSWTYASKHITGDAIDVCPFAQFQLHGANKLQWDETDPVWQDIGRIGESVGLKWGVARSGVHMDLGHFERAA